jgi:hypothetical protein
LPQLTRLIRSYRATGEIRPRRGSQQRFTTKYIAEDLELVIESIGRTNG